MLRLGLIFLTIAFLAAVVGFTGVVGVTGPGAWIAQAAFFVFLALFLVMLIASFVREAQT